ncbi:uncharacterized protein NKAPD1 [Aplysia californica]|uniref:Uncharacterized protein NKAPD1 n=1 Tax=Aplysia californica TaxID=6500 RepID=A0ABM0JJR3_APLCA|nr:uncharacterized protein NKAPD1 [Aplysia californica]XP_005095285.1 uncharacterized protein NKAPD1 [Aplysia californica]XP_012936227.1 uncharacterized protein NKAPD1 [Aplysia californica]
MASDQSSGLSRQAGLTHTAKSLLRNVIRHTDTHNRMKEESDMWQQFYKIRGQEPPEEDSDGQDSNRRGSKRSHDFKDRDRRREADKGDLDIHQSFLYDEREDMSADIRGRGRRHAHMDDRGSQSQTDRSTYWMRELHKAEDGDPDRWGHSGFKELYPQDYDSDRSHSSSSSTGSDRRKKDKTKDKRKEKKKKGALDRKDKKRKHARKKEKRKKRKKERDESGEDDSGDEVTMHRKKKRRKKKKESLERKRIKEKKKMKSEKEEKSSRKRVSVSSDSASEDGESEDGVNGEEKERRRSWRYENESEREKKGHGSASESPHRKRRRKE